MGVPAQKTLRQLIAELSDYELDSACTSLKFTVKTPRGGSLKHDYSARRAVAIAKAQGAA